MSFNVLGPIEAIEGLRRDLEQQRVTDPSFPWRFYDHQEEGPVVVGVGMDDLPRPHHRLLLRLTTRHPGIAIVTTQVAIDIDTGRIVNAELLRYSKGRRRTVASFRSDKPGLPNQRNRLLMALLRHDGNRKLERR